MDSILVTYMIRGEPAYEGHFLNTRTNLGRPAVWLRNHILVCPNCGEQWGAIILSHSEIQGFAICTGTCDKCGDGRLGQLLDPHNPDLPRALLERELLLTISLGPVHHFIFYQELYHDRFSNPSLTSPRA